MTDMKSENEILLALEKSLRDELHPVQPDQYFVGNLHKRLEDSPAYRRKRQLAVTLLTVAGGLVLGTAIFLIGRGFIENADKA